MVIQLFILRSKDGRVGFCFKKGDKHDVYVYGVNNIFRDMGSSGQVTNLKEFDRSYWLESTRLFTVTPTDLSDYDRCIKNWSITAGTYSVFESMGRTDRSFAEETIRFFSTRGLLVSLLTPPSILIRELTYTSKTRVDSLQIQDARRWYSLMAELNYSESDLIDLINESGQFYYYQSMEDEDRYYLLQGVRVTSSLIPLEMRGQEELLPVIAPTQVVVVQGTNCTTTTPVVTSTATTGSMFGMLAIVFLFTILIVLIVMAVVILEHTGETNLIGEAPIGIVEHTPPVVPASHPLVVPV